MAGGGVNMPSGAQSKTIKTLQRALEFEGELISISTNQFYSMDKKKWVTRYYVKKQVQDPVKKNKSTQVELFSSCSQIQITLFLRDYLFEIQGKEVPTDNEIWNAAKAEYFKGR